MNVQFSDMDLKKNDIEILTEKNYKFRINLIYGFEFFQIKIQHLSQTNLIVLVSDRSGSDL